MVPLCGHHPIAKSLIGWWGDCRLRPYRLTSLGGRRVSGEEVGHGTPDFSITSVEHLEIRYSLCDIRYSTSLGSSGLLLIDQVVNVVP